jgi:hypothetical protein
MAGRERELVVVGTVPVTPNIAPWERELLLDVMKRAAVAAFPEVVENGAPSVGASAAAEASTMHTR